MSTTPLLPVPIFRAFDSANLPLAGGLLYTYAAGTTTPQATYSDAAGSVQNANPVVLDTTGSAIVRLGTAAYKFVLKDSGGSTQWTIDSYIPISDTPTFAGTATANALVITTTASIGTNATVGGTLGVTGTSTLAGINATGTLALTGSETISGSLTIAGKTAATITSSSFTATITGMTVATTGTVKYLLVGGICCLFIEANITGTSNTTAMTLTGLPAACQPVTTGQRDVICYGVSDNTQSLQALATIDGTGAASPGTIAFGLFNTNGVANRIQAGTAFTNSGTKGLVNRWQVVYPL